MSESRFRSAAILGNGSFGMAIAKLLAEKMDAIRLIGRNPVTAATLEASRRSPHYLKNITLDANVRSSSEPRDALTHPLVIFAVPTSATRSMAQKLADLGLSTTTVLLSCAKGIERNSGDRMSQVLRKVFPQNPIAVLSGPNLAEEIAAKQATCAVVGSEDQTLAVEIQELFTTAQFRSYTSDDLAGIEFGGAVKNVYAIAAGMAHGLSLGDNAVAALVTRSLAEMTRLGIAMGGRMETFSGLSGVGDLMVTCFSNHSRNHRIGFALGRGQTLEEAVAELGSVAEGVPNTLSIHDAARRTGVRTPIIDAVHSILYTGKSVPLAMQELLSRDPRPEQS
ncbi:MAG: NAD(P)H-dependent glycerol-3-phosphate dehydrogenase [Verrucomicrobiota bacterium]